MKKLLPLILCCLFLKVSNGQITLTGDDISELGVIFKTSYDTANLGTITPGNAGASQTWDFSGLLPAANDEVRMLNRKTAPYNNKFPEANAVMSFMEDGTPLYIYIKADSNYLISQGVGYPEDWNIGPFDVLPQDTVFQFPVNYLDTWSGMNAIEIIQTGDTIKYKYFTVEFDTADAWGTITTPDTTLSALRIKSVEYKYDTTFYDTGGGNWVPVASEYKKQTTYAWWAKGLGYPLVEMKLDSLKNPIEIKYVRKKFSNVPMPYFGYDVDQLDVQFHDSTINTANAYLWYFGDGDSSYLQNPVHKYAMGGGYRVCFIAGDYLNNNFNSYCDTIYVETVITQSQLPVAGSAWVEVYDTTTNFLWVNPADTGVGLWWDYSSAFEVSYTSPIWVDNAANSEYYPEFPAATHYTEMEQDSSVGFYLLDSSGVHVIGVYNYTTAINSFIKFSNPSTIYPVPIQYGLIKKQPVFFDTSKMEAFFSDGLLKLIGTSYFEKECDAQGSLQTPSGYYDNVLRVKTKETGIDSIFVYNSTTSKYVFSNTSTKLSYQYEWLGYNGYDFPVIMSITTGGNDSTTTEGWYMGSNSCIGTTGISHITYNDSTYLFIANTNNDTIISQYWDLGDGTSIEAIDDIYHEYEKRGIYEVYLTTINNQNCVTHANKMIDPDNPDCYGNAWYDYDVDSLTVSFYDSSDINGNVTTTWLWNFGDGNEVIDGLWHSTDQNPVYTYNKPGNYQVHFITTDTTGCIFGNIDEVKVTGAGCYAEIRLIYMAESSLYLYADAVADTEIVDYEWDFGDGSPIEYNSDMIHAFPGPAVYEVCLTIYTADSCSYTACDSIDLLNPYCTGSADFDYAIDSLTLYCYNNSYIDGRSISNNVWHFGEQNGTVEGWGNSDEINPVYTYSAPGYYSVWVVVYDSIYDCIFTVQKFINITGDDCFVDFGYIPGSSDPQKILFTSKAAGNITDYYWEFGDGDNSIKENPVHIYDNAGSFEVCFTAHDVGTGCMDTRCELIQVGNDTTACYTKAFFTTFDDAGNSVFFVNKSTNYNSAYWDFGDGNYSEKLNIQHTFPDPGFYTVCMVAYDTLTGCMAYYCDVIKAGDSSSVCNVKAGFDFFSDQNTMSVSFKNKSLGHEYAYWDFGDGTNSNDLDPIHTYTEAGYYEVCMAAITIGTDTCIDFRCKNVQILDTDTTAPSRCNSFFIFTVDNSSKTVTFLDKSSLNTDFWYWNFNDYTVASNDQNPIHKFSQGGYYDVCLTVYSGNDCQNTFCKVIAVGDVSNDVYSAFSYFTDSVTSTAYFQNKSLGNVTKYNWDFGDGYFSTFKNPSHTYSDTGQYLVCLKVENSNNVSNTKCKYIRIGNTLANKCEYSCVWPGDANNSTEANHYDLLSICVSYGEKGPARDSVSTRWIGHYAENWTTKQFNGQNNKHVDCNGDGVIDTADIRGIIKNFASSHVYQPGKTRKYNATNPDLYFDVDDANIAPGTSVEVSIMTGRDTIALYGIGFELKVDVNKIQNKEIITDFSNSWLGVKGSNMLTFANVDQTLGNVSVSTSRFDKNDQIGYGEVSKISFTVDSSVTNGDELVICLTSDFGMNANGDTITFNNDYCDTLKVTGISSVENELGISVYPNPSKGIVYIDFPANLNGSVEIELLNTLGQAMLSKTISAKGEIELDIKKYDPGLYFLHVKQGDKQFKQRLVLIK